MTTTCSDTAGKPLSYADDCRRLSLLVDCSRGHVPSMCPVDSGELLRGWPPFTLRSCVSLTWGATQPTPDCAAAIGRDDQARWVVSAAPPRADRSAVRAGNVRRDFRKVISQAGTGLVPEEWTPREMRHSFACQTTG